MMRNFTIKNRHIGFIIYGIFITVILLYLLFPSDAVRQYLLTTAEQTHPRYHFSMDGLRPSFRMGLALLKIAIAERTEPGKTIFVMDRIFVRPHILSFIKRDKQFYFDGMAYGGDVEGVANLSGSERQPTISLEMEMQNLQMEENTAISQLAGPKLTGIIDGNLSFKGKQNLLIAGEGNANITISDGKVEFENPILVFEAIEFDNVSVQVILKKQKLNLSKVELQGRDMKASFTGSIFLQRNITNSRLNLRGSIEPYANFLKSQTGSFDPAKLLGQRLKKGKISIVIHGTVANPRIRFL